jgi:hypothetical protein
MADQEVKIKIGSEGDTSGIEKTKTALGSLKESIGKVGEIAAGIGLERAGEEIVNLGKEAVAFAVDTGREFETAKAQFDVLLGSAQKGSKMLADIAKYEPNTSFNFSQLTDATQELLSFGIAQDKVIPDLKVLGDVSMGNQAKLKELAFALGEVNTQQKLTAHEARIFTLGAHVPIYDMLAQYVNKTGMAMGSMNATMDAGTVIHGKHAKGVKDNSLQIERLTNSSKLAQEKIDFMSQSHTKAEKTAFSHKQTLERLNDTVDLNGDKMTKLAGAVNSASGAMGGATKVTAAQIKDMITAGKFSFQDVEAALKQSTEKGGMYFDAMKNHMHTFNGVLSSVQTQLQQTALAAIGFNMDQGSKDFGDVKAGSIFDDMKKGLQALLDFLNGHKTQIADFFQKSFSMAKTGIHETITAINGFKSAINGTQKFIKDNKDALEGLAGAIIIFVAPALIRLGTESVVAGLKMAVEFYAGIVKSVAGLSLYILTSPMVIAAKVKDIATTTLLIGMYAKDAIVKSAVRIATLAMTAGQWLLNAALTANPIGIVIVVLAALVTGIIYAYQHSATFRKIVNDLWETLKEFGKFLWDNLLGAIKAIGDALKAVGDAANNAGKAIGGAMSAHSNVPHHANGTNYSSGGLALVGEKGPELVNLPSGSQVIPNYNIGQGGGRGGVNITNYNTFQNGGDADRFARYQAFQINGR